VIESLPQMHSPMVADIHTAICRHYRMTRRQLIGTSKVRSLARPRQIGMYLAKQLTQRSLPEIGRFFGGRDHTTVIHAIRRVEELRQTDPEIAFQIDCVAAMVGTISATRMEMAA
jgi:chromosomal replication initiator protein